MNAIEAVVEVVKANEELTETLDVYESWFESLVGKTLIIEQRAKNKTRFVTAEVEEFEDVDVSDRDAARVGFTAAAIEQVRLAIRADKGQPVIRRQG